MWIVYYYNEEIAAFSTLDKAAKLKHKLANPGKVKIIFTR